MNVNDLVSLSRCKDYLFGPTTATDSDNILARLITSESRSFLRLTNRDTLAPTTKSVILDGNGNDVLMIIDTPLLAVSSLQIDNTAQIPAAPSTAPTAGRGYYFDADGRITVVGTRFCKARKNVFLTYTFGFANIPALLELQAIPATAPYIVTLANGSWVSDQGVQYFIGGTPLTRVFISPAAGQYFINTQTGQYIFNAADAGVAVQISYTYTGIPEDIQQCCSEMVGFTYGNRGSVGVTSEIISGAQTVNRIQDYPAKTQEIIKYYRRHYRGSSS